MRTSESYTFACALRQSRADECRAMPPERADGRDTRYAASDTSVTFLRYLADPNGAPVERPHHERQAQSATRSTPRLRRRVSRSRAGLHEFSGLSRTGASVCHPRATGPLFRVCAPATAPGAAARSR